MPAAAATNALDRLIGWMSPGAGVKRARARLALQMLRSYEAAKIGRRTGGWRATGASANAVIAPALSKLRDRSRELVRNNPYARKAIDSLVANALGTGITLKLLQGQALWDAWRGECDADGRLDFYGLQALAARTLLESGEVLVRFRPRRAQDGLSVPLQLQILEPDFLDASKTGVLAGGNYAISGVEFNSLGQVVAYWLFQHHPGELIARSLRSRRVPASEVLHLFEVLRAGQVRGVPRLTASMLRMRDLDDYEEAELVRKGIEACFAAFVTMNDEANTLAPSTTEAPEGENKRRIESLAAGMINYLRPGESVSFGSPATVEDYADYTRTQLHAIAAGAGITFEQLTGDLSQVNFSSMRAGMIEFRRMVTMWQWLTFIPQFCRPVLKRFAREAMLAGKLRSEDVIGAVWTTPKWDWVKPTEDVAATKEAISGGLKSLSESIRELGYDPDQVFAEIAEERAKLRKLGIVVDTDAEVKAKIPASKESEQKPDNDRRHLWPVR